MSTTIKDVAAYAKVSIATVSRVINNKGYISDKTRSNVLLSMKKLNHFPNVPARTLQGKNTATIGVILPSLDNPLYAELFEKIEQNLGASNFKTLLCTSNNQPKKEQEYFSLLKANQVEGIITSSHSNFLTNKTNEKYPIVCFDIKSTKNIISVKSDNYSGGIMIAKKVLDFKPKNVLILSGSKEDLYSTNDRIRGMSKIFKKNNIKINKSALDFESNISIKKVLVKKILSSKNFDAICCTDDLTALIALTVTKELDYDAQITGYDGSKFIRTFFPQLLTICQPISAIAELMCSLIIKKIKKADFPSDKEYVFPVILSSAK